ncbi:jouberin-like [Lycorma delicatula]|uniref:jouberin-like n=1 Tax=Lycorma delicatula TaxID=130591 RepID=UPI003F50D6DE
MNSSKQCLIDADNDELQNIGTTSEDDVLTVKSKVKPPVIIPRKMKNNNVKSELSSGSELNISDDNNADADKIMTISDISSSGSNNNEKNKRSLSQFMPAEVIRELKDKFANNKNSDAVKTPVPLPRRSKSKTTSPVSELLSSPNSERSDTTKLEVPTENIVIPTTSVEVIDEVRKRKKLADVYNDEKNKPSSHFSQEKTNIFSSSNEIDNDQDSDILSKKKRVKKKKKFRKRGSRDADEMELAEMGKSSSATTVSSVHSTKKKTDVTEETYSRKHSVPDTGLLGITVHGTDMLQPHALLRHPMVRVYIINVTTGQYLEKSDPTRPASFCDENVNYILPIITHPYDFKQHQSLVPSWEEVLVFNENMSHVIKQDTVIFFEVVDFVNLTLGGMRYQRLGSEGGWHHVAWAFVKLVAANGELNTEKKLRLQLYKPKNKIITSRKPTVPLVYEWWKEGLPSYSKYPSTLYITVGRVTPPAAPLTPNLRSRVVLQNEQGSAASIASTSAAQTDIDDNDEDADNNEDNETVSSQIKSSMKKHPSSMIAWTRLPTQSCKITNNKCFTIPVLPSGGFSIRFSHSGLHLACGTASSLLIFSVPQFKKLLTLGGHQGLIYNLRWSVDDAHLVSSSADCTACVWDLRKKHPTPQVLAHPSFVYCADFVPHFIRRNIVTGCCDGTVRVWTRNKPAPYHLEQEMTGHTGFVNTLCFSSDGTTFYSGDSVGQIKMWQYDHDCGEWSCVRNINIREIRGTVINNLLVHSGGNRMLVHTRDSILRMIDIPTYAVIQWFHGCCNERIQMSSCLTPCGSMVLSCSEDGLLCIWDCNTGTQLGLYNGLIKPSSSAAVAYHPHDHLMAVVSYHPDSNMQSQPLYICNYDNYSSGVNVGLKMFKPVERTSNLYLKENDKFLKASKKTNSDLWEKLESLSTQRFNELLSVPPHNIYTSTPQEKMNGNNLNTSSIVTSDDTKHSINYKHDKKQKRKKLLLDRKDNSWSKLSKASGFLVQKSITTGSGYNSKGETNSAFEDDFQSSISEQEERVHIAVTCLSTK